jgi:hypothetical protein
MCSKFVGGKPLGKVMEDNIEMDLKELGCDY